MTILEAIGPGSQATVATLAVDSCSRYFGAGLSWRTKS